MPPTTVRGDRLTGAKRPRLPPSPRSWIRSSLVEMSGPPQRPFEATDFLKSLEQRKPMKLFESLSLAWVRLSYSTSSRSGLGA